ncbi:MAG: dimethyladenosine transferase, rRNA (adenine1518-N6/adenine1519-N6)-dimethyltransferase [Candidatus Parcubacteria bacterium]|jgi:16S rRNA (adenine1518-N6/adenine1519-N6)-dimethyltransferase
MSEKFEHKKSLGQNFLKNDYAPKKMCDAANLTKGETVLEIGPGTGALTKEILARGANVIALEADLRAIESLETAFPAEIASGQLMIHHKDARVIPFSELGLKDQNYTVIANIPYYLSGLLFRSILESEIQPHTLVFLVQKEVATRIAREKKESLLSLGVKAFGTPTYICTVGRGHFVPPPKVDSAIIAIRGISRAKFKNLSIPAFFELLHLGFGQKRKQLVGNLSERYSRVTIEAALSSLSLRSDIRAEDISIDMWISLATILISTE